MAEEDRQDLRELEKLFRLHEKQMGVLMHHVEDLANSCNEYIQITNRTLKLHEKAIGILSARQKAMNEGR